VSWRRLYLRVRQATDWRVVVLGGILFAGLVTVSALLFFSLPRFQLQNSLFLERFIVRKARTGFSDSIKYNEITDIQQDTSVALSVDVSDHSRMPASPYWRMLVLDRYEDGSFKAALGLSGEITASELSGSQRWRRGEPVYWTFYLEAGVSRYLPLLGGFEELRFHERQVFRSSKQLGLVALRDEPVTMTAYRVEGFDPSGKLPDPEFARRWREATAAGGTLQQTYLGLSAADRMDLGRIADDIMARDRSRNAAGAMPAVATRNVSALEFSDRAGVWLRMHHGYSLSPKIPRGPGTDPLVRWLVSENSGHCELFAGSLVLLARAAGYPARVVTGFKGGTWNTYSNNLTLRNSDAHAWAEIFDEASGAWIRADALAEPTPAQNAQVTGSQGRTARFDRGWLARLESLRVFWYRRIVNFDQHTQVETLQAMKEATENTGVYLRGLWTGLAVPAKAWLAGPWDARRIGGFATAILAGIAGVWSWREFGRGAWRRWWHRAMGGRREDPVRADASRWLAKLAALQRRTPESTAVADELKRLRFGARVTWPPPEPVFRRARHALRSARRRRRE
jgi:transglutaminase-like putative cysteine protease